MAKSRHVDIICYAALILALIAAVLLMIFSGKSGDEGVGMTYENTLFDASVVHSIDIQMDDWDGFISSCEDEQYVACDVTVDGVTYKNVGIRAKGNTSLSNVSALGSSRYSFKIEFDCYADGQSCDGLDKLSLNNIIQDNTYMKDFLCYTMMNEFGVAAPLCSYSYLTVNGEDWGLYLAVEGVEESFLERNYGSDYGELYKPDSSDMGGGRGNGMGFEFDGEDFDFDKANAPQDDMAVPDMPENAQMPDMPDGDMPQGDMPDMPNDKMQDSPGMPQDGGFGGQNGDAPEKPTGGQMPDMPQGGFGEQGGDAPEMPTGDMPTGDKGGMDKPDEGTSRGSDDVLLKYSDDDPDSYPNIFDNAKTPTTAADEKRLIASLKKLNAGEDIESVVNTDEVLRYFVVHNFVCNFDSYTGSMIHNYYLYEEDGRLSMIPWDYNLAFGGFESKTDAASLVNSPIDDPVSGTAVSGRPMLAWIFADEEYTEMYHEYMARFISDFFDSGRFEELIDSTVALISPYVEKDPTKFCTYDEFETGAATLRQFCLLRTESIASQLDGTIPSTQDGQQSDKSNFVDASAISIDNMGGMDNTLMGGGDKSPSINDKGEPAMARASPVGMQAVITAAICAAVLAFAIIFAAVYKRRH